MLQSCTTLSCSAAVVKQGSPWPVRRSDALGAPPAMMPLAARVMALYSLCAVSEAFSRCSCSTPLQLITKCCHQACAGHAARKVVSKLIWPEGSA